MVRVLFPCMKDAQGARLEHSRLGLAACREPHHARAGDGLGAAGARPVPPPPLRLAVRGERAAPSLAWIFIHAGTRRPVSECVVSP
jgi:hypothetical protein